MDSNNESQSSIRYPALQEEVRDGPDRGGCLVGHAGRCRRKGLLWHCGDALNPVIVPELVAIV